LNDKNFNLLNYAIVNKASNEIIKFFIEIFSIPDYTQIQDSPLFHALSNNNYTIANILLKHNVKINNRGDQLLLELWKSNNNQFNIRHLNYLLKNGIDAECINNALKYDSNRLLLNILTFDFNVLEIILNHYIYTNNFIIMMLLTSKNKKSLSKINLKYILEKERNKFSYNSWESLFKDRGKQQLFNKFFNPLIKINYYKPSISYSNSNSNNRNNNNYCYTNLISKICSQRNRSNKYKNSKNNFSYFLYSLYSLYSWLCNIVGKHLYLFIFSNLIFIILISLFAIIFIILDDDESFFISQQILRYYMKFYLFMLFLHTCSYLYIFI